MPPFPPQGPSDWFPCLIGTTAALRNPIARPRLTSFPRSAVPRPRPQSATEEATGAPRFLGIPCVHALLSDPGGPSCRALAPIRAPARRYCLPQLQRRRLQRRYFGALSHGLHTRCLRFAARVDLRTTQTRFRLGPALTGRAARSSRPAGIHREVSAHGFLLTQAFPGALQRLVGPPAWAGGSAWLVITSATDGATAAFSSQHSSRSGPGRVVQPGRVAPAEGEGRLVTPGRGGHYVSQSPFPL